ncbi:MAG TPA: hypothetical protein VKH34_14120 [Vicinamibacterales bacterium]|nr:hypothetical protein [Vicinamibacterales bacterium]
MHARSLLLAAALITLVTGTAFAQQPRARANRPQPQAGAPQVPGAQDGPISAGKVAQLFDAYTMVQAQEALQLPEEQYGRFVTRFKALQDSRRRHQAARNQIMVDLRRQTNPQNGANDEGILTERLKSLRDEDDRAAVELKRAYEAVEETLDVRQQARLRVFEERMEQQKLELVMKARQNARAAARGGRP